MPKLIIDGIEVEVPEGTNVLEAAKRVGIVIPHFCYHSALGSVGACRLCAMTFLEGPVKGVQVSCMVKAADGMVVSTTHGDAARLRRMVIEWLMLNHPHDCPVCDEGGMCLLQDYTIAGGHSRRRYKGRKRTYSDQYLGEFIYQEMNRCIQCYRCSRFYQDYAGGTDFGPMQISNKVFFGRFQDGWLESPFHGNLAEVCPTGVFTDKTYRYKSRPWDLMTAPSVCPHCSLGCNTIPGAKYRELMRVTARENQKVNGWFICDRGRFGYRFARRPDRPYKPRVAGKETDFGEARQATADRISDVLRVHGPQALAFMGSPRASVESNFMLAGLARALGSDNICFSPDPARERKDRLAASLLKEGLRRSLKEVEDSDLMIVAGADPINEAPMLALLMRQAARKGAGCVVLDPRPVKLPFEYTHTPVPLDKLADALSGAVKKIKDAGRPTIIVGTDVGGYGLIERAAKEAEGLRATGMDCGIFYTMSAANSFGAALLAGSGGDFEDILEKIEVGTVKLLVVLEANPFWCYPDRQRAENALLKLEALIVLDHVPTKTVRMADVFLPSTAYAEEDGTFVNNEGRAQAYGRAYYSGIPIAQMAGPELHPPRAFFHEIPDASQEAWKWLQEVRFTIDTSFNMAGSVEELRLDMATENPALAPLAGLDPYGVGERVFPAATYSPPREEVKIAVDGLRLLPVDLTFGSEELSIYSDKTQLRAPKPYVLMHPDEADKRGLRKGEAEIEFGGKKVRYELKVDGNAAKGIIIAPRLHGFDLSEIGGRQASIKQAAEK